MVAQRTLTPYVRVRILLPLPKNRSRKVVVLSFWHMIYALLMQKSCICILTEYVLPLSLPQLKVLPLNGDKSSSADDEIDGAFFMPF